MLLLHLNYFNYVHADGSPWWEVSLCNHLLNLSADNRRTRQHIRQLHIAEVPLAPPIASPQFPGRNQSEGTLQVVTYWFHWLSHSLVVPPKRLNSKHSIIHACHSFPALYFLTSTHLSGCRVLTRQPITNTKHCCP